MPPPSVSPEENSEVLAVAFVEDDEGRNSMRIMTAIGCSYLLLMAFATLITILIFPLSLLRDYPGCQEDRPLSLGGGVTEATANFMVT